MTSNSTRQQPCTRSMYNEIKIMDFFELNIFSAINRETVPFT